MAYKLASQQLAGLENIEEQCRRAGAECQVTDGQGQLTVAYLGRPYLISLPGVAVSVRDSDEAVPLFDRILVVHYVLQASGTPLTGRVVSYKELPGGSTYFPNFSQRAIRPILKNFGAAPERLVAVAAALGGQPVDYGDVAVTVSGFPRVPVTVVLWRGDEEFPPDGNLLFDGSVMDYLSTEDVNVLSESLAHRLVGLLKESG